MISKIYTAIALLLVSFSFTAQAQVFFTEDFSGGIPAGWTNEDLTSQANQLVIFQHTTDPNAVAPAALGNAATSVFNAPGAANGYVWANSDRGLASAPAEDHTTQLTTTPIDCSAQTSVFLSFANLIGVFDYNAETNAIVRVSTDGGSNWTSYTVFPGLTTSVRWSANPFNANIDLTTQAAGQPSVIIQFQWIGGWDYFWAIDDIVLTAEDPRPANDMRINDFLAVAPNVFTPASQVEPIGFIADVANIGSAAQDEVVLYMTIVDDASGDLVYLDSVIYNDILSDQTIENVFFPSEFLPASTEATYTATYSLGYAGSNDDGSPENNEFSFPIAVNDTLFAKEFRATRSVRPAASTSYTYGNIFYVPNGDGLFGRYVQFAGIPRTGNSLAGEEVTILVYAWEGDTNENGLADGDELLLEGFNSYQFDGTEGQNLITVEANEGGGLALEDDKYYYVAVQYTDVNNKEFFLLGSEDFDYSAMNFYTDSLMRPRYASALSVDNTDEYSLIAFGFDLVPVVRFSVGNDIVIINTEEPQLAAEALKLYPNPVHDVATLEFNLAELAPTATVSIYNQTAQLVRSQQFDNVQFNRVSIDTNDLPSGNYLMKVTTDQGVRTIKVAVQH